MTRRVTSGDREALPLLGVAALLCYAGHGAFHLLHARPEDLLWACHLGAAVVGVGLLAGSPTTNGLGTLWLSLGTPLWLMDLAAGGVLYPSSFLTHVGGLGIGLYGVRRIGLPRGTWWKATAALMVLILFSRLVTPAAANVNVAFSIHRGWESLFPSHPVYLVAVLSLATGFFFVVERGLRRFVVGATSREVGV